MAEADLQEEMKEHEADLPPVARRHAHPSTKEYVRIGVILGVLTALEIASSYNLHGASQIAALFTGMTLKFALVVLWYMHLKFDSRLYARFFVMGLAGAATLYLIVLASFRVFLR
jgi:caa(3)-type oxidase subunit IV